MVIVHCPDVRSTALQEGEISICVKTAMRADTVDTAIVLRDVSGRVPILGSGIIRDDDLEWLKVLRPQAVQTVSQGFRPISGNDGYAKLYVDRHRMSILSFK